MAALCAPVPTLSEPDRPLEMVDRTMHHADRTIMIVGATLAKRLTSSRR
ncbi:hypothetical protein [Dactylosporangium darangshiense]